MDRCRFVGPHPSPAPNLFNGVQDGNQSGANDAGGATLKHALKYKYSRLRQQGAQLDSLLHRGYEEMPASLVPQATCDGPDTQTIRVGLDHGTAYRPRRRFAQDAVVSRQRVQIDCQ